MGLYKKMAQVASEIGRVAKNGRNDFHKYDYVLEADLVEKVRTELAKEGIAYFFSVVNVRTESFDTVDKNGEVLPAKNGPITTVETIGKFVDGETGESEEIRGFGTGQDAGDKGLYKAITGAQKYMLMKTFMVPTGDDPERTPHEQKPLAAPKSSTVLPKSQAATPPAAETIPGGPFKGRVLTTLSIKEANELVAGTTAGSAWRLRAEAYVKSLVPEQIVAFVGEDAKVVV